MYQGLASHTRKHISRIDEQHRLFVQKTHYALQKGKMQKQNYD